MLTRVLIAASAVALSFADGRAPAAATRPATLVRDLPALPPEAWAPQDEADATYRRAREALARDRFREAAALFREIEQKWPRSTYVPEALYWRAFALSRIGDEPALREAVAALDEQARRFPNARTAGDARTLRTRLTGQLARRGDADAAGRISEQARGASEPCPRDDDESDMRVAALNALMQMDEDRAFPILRDVMRKRERCSESLRRRAVFILSQHDSPEAMTLLLDVVRNDPSREVREHAVQWLGQMKGPQVTAALQEIALGDGDVALREKAIFALAQQETPQARTVLRTLAEREGTPRAVRDKAIFWIGQDASPDNAQFLRGLFARLGRGEANEELRKRIMFSLSQMEGQGNDRWLLAVAQDTGQSVELRKHALFTAGQADVPAAELIALYGRMRDAALKEQLIWVLSESDERAATDKVVDIARNDPDVRMRKRALFWLGQRNDPRIQQLLLEIINKG
ncbi:MAG TPA: HEAT repeat domain-containing protein [Gemmatimonadaceae bacterium]|nr:HEAT repeat domain-containing protein [Gemmatimonadaceae bacterium]